MFATYGKPADDDRMASYGNLTCFVPWAIFGLAIDRAMQRELGNFAPSPGAILSAGLELDPADRRYDPVNGTEALKPPWFRAMLAAQAQRERPRMIGGRTAHEITAGAAAGGVIRGLACGSAGCQPIEVDLDLPEELKP